MQKTVEQCYIAATADHYHKVHIFLEGLRGPPSFRMIMTADGGDLVPQNFLASEKIRSLLKRPLQKPPPLAPLKMPHPNSSLPPLYRTIHFYSMNTLFP